ncbi:MAG TPA: hypothetical protein PKE20_12620, partial [Promineifilum sp.]|nr:hypothetical protein [Promineifilum sp.]
MATRSARAEAIDLLGEGMIVVLGAAIAASALQSDVPSGVLVAVATAVGLMSMVAGLFHALQSAPRQMASAIRPALGGLALTAAVWIGPTALVPAARLVVFAPAMLIVAAQLGARELDASVDGLVARRSSPKMVAVLIVLLALTGLPLTVGFDVLSSLYGAWLGAGGWALLLLTALLLSFWVVAMVQSGRAAMRGEAAGRTAWLRSAALLPPLLGLISLRLPATDVMPLICVALAAPLVTGLVLARFMPGLACCLRSSRGADGARCTDRCAGDPRRRIRPTLAAGHLAPVAVGCLSDMDTPTIFDLLDRLAFVRGTPSVVILLIAAFVAVAAWDMRPALLGVLVHYLFVGL